MSFIINHRKNLFIILLLIELICRFIIYFDYQLVLEPFGLSMIRCPHENPHIKLYIGWRAINFFTIFRFGYDWIRRCHIVHYEFYLFNLITMIDLVLFITIVTDLLIQIRTRKNLIVQK